MRGYQIHTAMGVLEILSYKQYADRAIRRTEFNGTHQNVPVVDRTSYGSTWDSNDPFGNLSSPTIRNVQVEMKKYRGALEDIFLQSMIPLIMKRPELKEIEALDTNNIHELTNSLLEQGHYGDAKFVILELNKWQRFGVLISDKAFYQVQDDRGGFGFAELDSRAWGVVSFEQNKLIEDIHNNMRYQGYSHSHDDYKRMMEGIGHYTDEEIRSMLTGRPFGK